MTVLCIACGAEGQAQQKTKQAGTRRLVIVTIDGFRWQEVFGGADEQIIGDTQYVKDPALAKALYWDSTAERRRQRLLPFFWNTIAEKGRLYGNRNFNNRVNVKNFYKISYPGYNEIFTGHTDAFISPNLALYNKNNNVLEYLNASPAYRGKVAVFTSWSIFPYILNEPRNGLPVNSGYEKLNEKGDTTAVLIDSLGQMIPKTKTRYDWLTWLSAREYITLHHPSVLFLGLGETDEFAHAGRYDLYLQHAADIDRMISDLWYMLQTDPFYKDSTTLLITTDHGRGRKPNKWTTHGFWAGGSGDIWMAVMGPDIEPAGELRIAGQIYQNQLAATMTKILGDPAGAGHPPGTPIALPVPMRPGDLAQGK